MKIGILTFHRALNYGAVLQAYALYEFLVDMGFDVEIIDYRNQSFEDVYYSFKVNLRHLQQFKNQKFKSMLRRCLEVFYLRLLRQKFENLLYNKKSTPVTEKVWKETISKYDMIITGSDQVWNKELTNNDMIYFLRGVPKAKRLSFAASVGAFDIVNDEEALKELKEYSFLSFRETETLEKLQDIVKKECRVHMDPVFLLGKEKWKKIMKLPNMEKNYVLIFSMNKLPKLVDYAKDYAEKHGIMKVYHLSPALRRARRKNVRQIWFASPEEFLGWFNRAEYIFTDSFHGCAFSIIFGKPFYVDINRTIGSSNRILNLLHYFECEENAELEQIGNVKKGKDFSSKIELNYDSVKKYFNNIRGT